MAVNQNDPDEEPLEPKVEAIRVKMMRLLVVSGGIMMLGLMAVVISIVYKINQGSEQATGQSVEPVTGEIALPSGARILSTALSGSRMMFTIEQDDGSREVLVYDAQGKLTSRFQLK